MRCIAEFAPQGDYVGLKRTGVPYLGHGEKRGIVTSFSPKSRSRLLRKIAMTKKHILPVFVTLTYPENYPSDFREYKRHLHNFWKACRYAFSEFGAIWKLEFQKRGAPHFHIFFYGVSVEKLRTFVPQTWFRIAGGGDVRHLYFHEGKAAGAEHCVQPVRSWNGVKSYSAKYMCKLDGETNRPGRVWGCVGFIPMSSIIQFKIDVQVALEFKRYMRRLRGLKSRRFGFWCYGYHVDLLRLVEQSQEEYEDSFVPPPFPIGWWLHAKDYQPLISEDDWIDTGY